MDSAWIISLLIMAPPLLMSLTVHEYAHARTALAFGDPTALHCGRVTLNPLAHLDPIGTICLFLSFFGWAKPVPVNVANLHPRGLGNFSVSLAGPLSNLLLALVSAILLRILLPNIPKYYIDQLCVQSALMAMLLTMVLVNIALCIFNLVPLFPLDGHHILQELLPSHMHYGYMMWQRRFGMYVLLGMVFLLPALQTYHLLPESQIVNPVGYVIGSSRRFLLTSLHFPPQSYDSMNHLQNLISPKDAK